jgi:hypothetical protein
MVLDSLEIGLEDAETEQAFRSTCPAASTSRASVPASNPKNAHFCPEKR